MWVFPRNNQNIFYFLAYIYVFFGIFLTFHIFLFLELCFIIYAGSVDKYAKKLLDILEALNEVILNYDDSSAPGLFILVSELS